MSATVLELNPEVTFWTFL